MSTVTWTRSDLAGTNAGLAGPVRMWTPPARRAYSPKAHDPGQRISWTLATPAHWSHPPQGWNEPMPADSEWVKASETIRYGTIWSAGPRGIRSVWVQPDDAEPGDMVLVHTGTLIEQSHYDTAWQRRIVRVCDNLNASAGLFRELKAERRWGDYKPQDYLVAYHCDGLCPAIRHRTDDVGHLVPSTGDTIRGLLSGKQDTSLCATCIWLDPDARTEAESNAHAHLGPNSQRVEHRHDNGNHDHGHDSIGISGWTWEAAA